MPVRWRTAAGRDMHVDDAEASGSLLACHGDGVGKVLGGIRDRAGAGEVVDKGGNAGSPKTDNGTGVGGVRWRV